MKSLIKNLTWGIFIFTLLVLPLTNTAFAANDSGGNRNDSGGNNPTQTIKISNPLGTTTTIEGIINKIEDLARSI